MRKTTVHKAKAVIPSEVDMPAYKQDVSLREPNARQEMNVHPETCAFAALAFRSVEIATTRRWNIGVMSNAPMTTYHSYRKSGARGRART